MKFTIYQESRLGKRDNNEDRIGYCYSRDALLMIIADGMGGHYYGEIASQIAAQTLTDAFNREAKPKLDNPFEFLQCGMMNAHYGIINFASERNLKDSPRTTCVACLVQDDIAYWAHVGDSRLYHMRNGEVIHQTRDHSRVRLLFEQGAITEAQMVNHPERNKVYRCLGGPLKPEIDFSPATLLDTGDVILLSTDGFWGPLSAEIIASSLRQANLMQAVPILLNQAERRGGPYCDNVSVVAMRWSDSEFEPSESSVVTKTMVQGSVTTHLDEFGRNPQNKLNLGDEEIEKAISEIRASIDKYSNLPKK